MIQIISKQTATGALQIEICLVRINTSFPYFLFLGRNYLEYIYFIFYILNIFIQGTNSISKMFYNLALLKLNYLINYYK